MIHNWTRISNFWLSFTTLRNADRKFRQPQTMQSKKWIFQIHHTSAKLIYASGGKIRLYKEAMSPLLYPHPHHNRTTLQSIPSQENPKHFFSAFTNQNQFFNFTKHHGLSHCQYHRHWRLWHPRYQQHPHGAQGILLRPQRRCRLPKYDGPTHLLEEL